MVINEELCLNLVWNLPKVEASQSDLYFPPINAHNLDIDLCVFAYRCYAKMLYVRGTTLKYIMQRCSNAQNKTVT